MNGPNKLEDYITLGFKGLAGANTQAYGTYSDVMKNIVFTTLHFLRNL